MNEWPVLFGDILDALSYWDTEDYWKTDYLKKADKEFDEYCATEDGSLILTGAEE